MVTTGSGHPARGVHNAQNTTASIVIAIEPKSARKGGTVRAARARANHIA
jgi:hypothetical protein